MSTDRPLWTCPRCGNTLVTPNMPHSCGSVELAAHFERVPPEIRTLFEAWVGFVVEHGGPTTVIPQRSRIALQRRVRFGSVHVRRRWLDCGLWLRRRVYHPRLNKVEDFGPAKYHWFRLTEPGQLDDDLAALVAEAYRSGDAGSG